VGGIASAQLIPGFGWHSIFYAGGVGPLLLLPVLWWFLPESARFLALTGDGAQLSTVLERMGSSVRASDLEPEPAATRSPIVGWNRSRCWSSQPVNSPSPWGRPPYAQQREGKAAQRKVFAAADRHGVALIGGPIVNPSAATCAQALDDGISALCIGLDVLAFRQVCETTVAAANAAVERHATWSDASSFRTPAPSSPSVTHEGRRRIAFASVPFRNCAYG
jgi:hypothetical protein